MAIDNNIKQDTENSITAIETAIKIMGYAKTFILDTAKTDIL